MAQNQRIRFTNHPATIKFSPYGITFSALLTRQQRTEEQKPANHDTMMKRKFSATRATICLLWSLLWCLCDSNGWMVHGFLTTASSSSLYYSRATNSLSFFAATSSETPTEAASKTSSSTLTLFSPCKINLFLRIIRKREDGYHDLASLFQAIGFGDTLELTPLSKDATADEFTCNMEGVPLDSTNLVLRALELMRTKTGVANYFSANLIKQVPAQAGLGGGSANAATAMWAANELMGRPASLEQVS
jgi:hypothetical protein